MKLRNDERLAILMLVTGNVFWGFNNVMTKLALSIASPWVLLSMRFILALIVLSVPVLLGIEKLHFRRKNPLSLLLYIIIEPLYFFLKALRSS